MIGHLFLRRHTKNTYNDLGRIIDFHLQKSKSSYADLTVFIYLEVKSKTGGSDHFITPSSD